MMGGVCLILLWLLLPLSRAGATVAFLSDSNLPGLNQSLIDDLVNFLKSSDIKVLQIDSKTLANSSTFNSNLVDYLILTQAPLLPYQLPNVTKNYVQYLQTGGHLLSMGGKPPTLSNVSLKAIAVNIMSDYEPYVLTDVTLTNSDSSSYSNASGLSAVAWAFSNEADFYPFVVAQDEFERLVGYGFSLLNNTGGAYKGSRWWITGITTLDFYTSDFFKKILKAIVLGQFGARDAATAAATLFAQIESQEKSLTVLTNPVTASSEDFSAYLSLSDDRRSIVYPNGDRYFMIGADFYRSLSGEFDADTIERDFLKAARAGLNTLRMFGYCDALENQTDVLNAIRQASLKFGIHCLIDMDCKPEKDPRQKNRAGVELTAVAIARVLRSEKWVLGYDLCNEPYYFDIGNIYVNETTALKQIYNYTDHKYKFSDYQQWLNPGYSSTFPNVEHGLPIPDEFEPVLSDISNIYGTWMKWRIDAIRQVENHSLLTVGYNTIFGLLDVNEALDFVSHHAYPNAPGYQFTINNFTDTLAVPTTMDRLASVWHPSSDENTKSGFPLSKIRPISYGEFGTSNGDLVGRNPDAQSFVDFQTGALYDMMSWLRMLWKEFSGAIRWRLNDKPYTMSLRQESYIGPDANQETHEKYMRENRFGYYWYDGTKDGRAKPVAYCTRFLSDYMRFTERQSDGVLTIFKADTPVHAGYVFNASNAFFIGDSAHSSNWLQFSPMFPTSDSCSNLMMYWNSSHIRVMTSADTLVSLDPSALVANLSADSVEVIGFSGGWSKKEKTISMKCLSGSPLWISNLKIKRDVNRNV